jgi:hypothetical protein
VFLRHLLPRVEYLGTGGFGRRERGECFDLGARLDGASFE